MALPKISAGWSIHTIPYRGHTKFDHIKHTNFNQFHCWMSCTSSFQEVCRFNTHTFDQVCWLQIGKRTCPPLPTHFFHHLGNGASSSLNSWRLNLKRRSPATLSKWQSNSRYYHTSKQTRVLQGKSQLMSVRSSYHLGLSRFWMFMFNPVRGCHPKMDGWHVVVTPPDVW